MIFDRDAFIFIFFSFFIFRLDSVINDSSSLDDISNFTFTLLMAPLNF